LITSPQDQSSSTIQKLLENAPSDVVFIGDPRVTVTPAHRMFERMTRVLEE